ncbi:motility quorum-sensing regulator / GCU-specific mRNA interferase toxin [Gammaproteobacteria bacterium]
MGMEKRKAHYDLETVKAILAKRGVDTFTQTALRGIDDMGLTQAEGVMVVLSLRHDMFLKSMTTHADHRVWQDVYHAPCPNGKIAYIKLTIQAGATVIQFKEK